MTLQQARALAELEKAFTSVGERLRSVQAPPADTVTLEEGVIGDTLKEKIAWHLDYLGKKDLLLNLDLRGVSGFDPEKHKRLRGCTLDESEARCWYQKMAESKHTAFKWADISIKSRTCVQNVAMAREEKVTSDRFMALSLSIERMIDGIKIYSEPFAVHGEIITTTAGNRHDLSETDRNSLISTIVMSAGPLSSITSAAIIAVKKCDGGGLRVMYTTHQHRESGVEWLSRDPTCCPVQ